jgi:acetoin utilization protein AcuB
MRHIPAIKSVMTPFPYSVDISKTLQFAQDFLQKHKLGHLPITNNDELSGVISQREIYFYSQQQSDNETVKVADIPLQNKYIVDLNERLDRILLNMADKRLDCALVTKHGRLVGIFTSTDVCRSFARYLEDQFGPPSGDEAA